MLAGDGNFCKQLENKFIRHEITPVTMSNRALIKTMHIFFPELFLEEVCLLLSLGPSFPLALGCLYWRITPKASEQVKSSNNRWSHSCGSMVKVTECRVILSEHI